MTGEKPRGAVNRDNIIHLFGDRDEVLPELDLDVPTESGPSRIATGSGVDLTGKVKVVMVFGAGRSGKSMLLRWMAERAQEDGVVLATADKMRPTLKQFIAGTMALDHPTGVEKLLSRLLDVRDRTAFIDFGADQTLVPLLTHLPDLQAQMEGAGVEPVALYLLTPREGDLSVLKVMEATKFKPVPTALVLNMGTMMTDYESEWAQLRRHSVYRGAVERGAVEVWMPKLWPSASKAVEERRIGFADAMNHAAGEGKTGLGMFDRSRVHHWLEAMDDCFAPIKTWLRP